MSRLLNLIRSEVGAGLLLLFAALTAMVLANSPLADTYSNTLGTRLRLGVSDWSLEKSLLLWINDGLMAIFFMLVGLEIKRELLGGELSDPRRAALPVAGALGGMLGPALIYAFINRDSPESLSGWPIPAATDIAFAFGYLGTR
jgi:NhaA family Na+:H+ antiporter